MMHARGFWLEIVTLVIPGFNDSAATSCRLTALHRRPSRRDIPWHVTAFHGDYKMTDPENTTADMLLGAADIGREAGLRYVYAGNLPGQVGELENTHCATCGETLVSRAGYHIRKYRITPGGACPSCGSAVPGRWSPRFDGQIASRPFVPMRHLT